MDPFDRQIVQYMRVWAPFGGPPPEEVLPSFGLTPTQFEKRFKAIIASLQAREAVLTGDDRELLVTVQSVLSAQQPLRTNT